jgi:AcrR family transcriptional regulator
LFGTKKNLFKAAIKRCRSETLQAFQAAAEGRRGPQALDAIAARYVELLHDRPRLLGRLQATGAGDDQRDHDPFGPQGSRRVGQSAYPLGVKVSDRELAAVPMRQHDWHGEWNYTVQPTAA